MSLDVNISMFRPPTPGSRGMGGFDRGAIFFMPVDPISKAFGMPYFPQTHTTSTSSRPRAIQPEFVSQLSGSNIYSSTLTTLLPLSDRPFEVSARLHYLCCSDRGRPDPFVGWARQGHQPGQAFHANFAAS